MIEDAVKERDVDCLERLTEPKESDRVSGDTCGVCP